MLAHSSSLTFKACRVSKNKTVGLWVLLEWDELLSGSALLRDTELRELELNSAITHGYCSTAHSTFVKCSMYAGWCSVFMHYARLSSYACGYQLYSINYIAGIMYSSDSRCFWWRGWFNFSDFHFRLSSSSSLIIGLAPWAFTMALLTSEVLIKCIFKILPSAQFDIKVLVTGSYDDHTQCMCPSACTVDLHRMLYIS